MSTKTKILELIYDNDEDGMYGKKLAERLSVDQSVISRAVNEMVERGLIHKQKKGRVKYLHLTDEGEHELLRRASEEHPPSADASKDGEGDAGEVYEGEVSLHKNSIGFKIMNQLELERDYEKPMDWRNRFVDASSKEWRYQEENDVWKCTVKTWDFQIGRENVHVRLPEVVREDVDAAMWAVYESAMEARDWMEQHTPIRLSSQPANMKIWPAERHIADIRNPLARWLRDETSLDLDSFRVFDEEENLRLWMDDSHEEAHLEAAGAYDQDDMSHIRGHYRWMIEEKEQEKRLRGLPDEVDAATGDLNKLKAISENLLRMKIHEEFQKGRVDERNKSRNEERIELEGSDEVNITFAQDKYALDCKRNENERKEERESGWLKKLWRWVW